MTPPMIFVMFGIVTGTMGLGIVHIDADHGVVHTIATMTLVLVLFSDAGRISPRGLKRRHVLPQRLLLFGLPLTVLLGAATAKMVWPEFDVWEAALIGAILAPTDPALSQAVVSDQAVPARIRQALNVESGLNDGIALPIVLFFAAMANAVETDNGAFALFASESLAQLFLGPAVGTAIGFLGARLARIAVSADAEHSRSESLAVLAAAALAFASAQLVGGNGFLSAFMAGLTFGAFMPDRFMFQFMDVEGQMFTLFAFLLIGTTLVPETWALIDFKVVAYGALSLTVIRMVPTMIALLGTAIRWQSYVFIGWFGPRGLASVLFVLLITERYELQNGDLIFSVVICTVLLSIFLHGLTSAVAARLYGRTVAGFGPCEEIAQVEEIPTRYRRIRGPGK